MNCPQDIYTLMHDFLDEDISTKDEESLRDHLHSCENCLTHFQELKKSIALVQSTSHIEAPADFTLKVMNQLPKEKKYVRARRWFQGHPFITAASLFLILMVGSVFSLWSDDQQFSVTRQPNLIIDQNVVTVPRDEVIQGDLVIKNGSLKIEGTVEGNVTIINGENYLASAGQVTGEIKEINAIFDWIWYHLKTIFREVFNLAQSEES